MTPAERKAARLARIEATAQKRRLTRARRALARAGADRGVKPRLLAGLAPEVIAREIADRGDALLDWDAWLSGPIGDPVAAVLEFIDGPTIYAAALELVTLAHTGLVRAGRL